MSSQKVHQPKRDMNLLKNPNFFQCIFQQAPETPSTGPFPPTSRLEPVDTSGWSLFSFTLSPATFPPLFFFPFAIHTFNAPGWAGLNGNPRNPMGGDDPTPSCG